MGRAFPAGVGSRSRRGAPRGHLGLEHLEGDDVDQHDPDGRVEQLGLVLGEGDGGDALALQLLAVRVAALQLAVDVLLELLHVEELERLLELEGAVGQLEDVVGHGVLLEGVLDEDGVLGEALDQDVARLVHLDLAALADLRLELLRLRVAHRVLEAVHSDPEKKNNKRFALMVVPYIRTET